MLTSEIEPCIICYEDIEREDRIWSCNCCYAQYHLACIIKWINESIASQRRKAIEESPSSTPSSTSSSPSPALLPSSPSSQFPWSCPTCRKEYNFNEKPERYYCYCGKLCDPPAQPWLLPHSCGEHCNRTLTNCAHQCTLLCHPGPCPPCPRQLTNIPCHCQRSTPRTLRCSQKLWSCGQVCSTLLSCKQHHCALPCHQQPCPPCRQIGWKLCSCGKERKMLSCDSEEWHCNQICNRLLDCGNHYCQRFCHIGECTPCLWLAEQHCPCGKTTYPGKSTCLGKPQFSSTTTAAATNTITSNEDFIGPPCDETCKRLLACGQHYCTDKCHTGACGLCREIVNRKCRCGATKNKVQCHKGDFTCQVKCSRLRDCGRHPCRRKCCGGRGESCAPCDQICNRPLACGHHRCKARCHAGPCYPCAERMTLHCPCGQTQRTIPCGLDKKAARLITRTTIGGGTPSAPITNSQSTIFSFLIVNKERKKIFGLSVVCVKNCPKKSRCGVHTNPHKCHDFEEECPPCHQLCDAALNCGHRCPAKCHVAVGKVIRLDKSKLAGPWAARDDGRMEWHCLPCPPCRQPIPITCLGGHEDIPIPCCERREVTCGRLCGRPLTCTNHNCSLPCHRAMKRQKKIDLTTTSDGCETCSRDCDKPRPSHCVHPCSLIACHPGACPPCSRSAPPRPCHCGKLQILIDCIELGRLLTSTNSMELHQRLTCPASCERPRLKSCGHPCGRQCHPGPCEPENKDKTSEILSVECNVKIALHCDCGKRKMRITCHNYRTSPPPPMECDFTKGCRPILLNHGDKNLKKSFETAIVPNNGGDDEDQQEENVVDNNFSQGINQRFNKQQRRQRNRRREVEIVEDSFGQKLTRFMRTYKTPLSIVIVTLVMMIWAMVEASR